MSVNIKGLNRDKLLHKLWLNGKPARYFLYQNKPAPEFVLSTALEEIRNYHNGRLGRAEYVCGRYIKTDVYTASDELDPALYDLEYGQGALQRAVDELREEQNS